MTIAEYVAQGRARIEKATLQCADPLLHMKQIVEVALGIDTATLYVRWGEAVGPEDLKRLDALLERRLSGEPFQYICGYEWFWSSRFEVGPGVLIPRRETERLVEILLAEEPRASGVKVAELGAGSGNIGLTVCLERPGWEWHAFEKNPDSVPYVRRNQKTHLSGRDGYHLHEGDFFAGVGQFAPFDWIAANPPYVAREYFPGLSKEVRHEPPLALDGGARGIECLARIIEECPAWLRPGGGLCLEIGFDQGEWARETMTSRGFKDVRILFDYSGLPRVALARGLA